LEDVIGSDVGGRFLLAHPVLRQFLSHTYFNKFPVSRVFHILYIIRDGEPA